MPKVLKFCTRRTDEMTASPRESNTRTFQMGSPSSFRIALKPLGPPSSAGGCAWPWFRFRSFWMASGNSVSGAVHGDASGAGKYAPTDLTISKALARCGHGESYQEQGAASSRCADWS